MTPIHHQNTIRKKNGGYFNNRKENMKVNMNMSLSFHWGQQMSSLISEPHKFLKLFVINSIFLFSLSATEKKKPIMQTIMIMNGVIKLRCVHNGLEKLYTTSLKRDLENTMKKELTLKQNRKRFKTAN